MCDTSALLHLTEAEALPLLSRMGDVSVPRAVDVEMTQHSPLWQTEKPSWTHSFHAAARCLEVGPESK